MFKTLFITILFLSGQLIYANPYLKSMSIPGWGQYSLNEKKRSQIFFSSDISLLISYIGAKSAAKWYEQDYQAYAALYAQVDMSNKNSQFAYDIGKYNNIDAFNQENGRMRSESQYEYGKGYDWHWSSDSQRIEYESIRKKSMLFNKTTKFLIAGLIVNRLISVIDVLYLKRVVLSYQPSFQKEEASNITLSYFF